MGAALQFSIRLSLSERDVRTQGVYVEAPSQVREELQQALSLCSLDGCLSVQGTVGVSGRAHSHHPACGARAKAPSHGEPSPWV